MSKARPQLRLLLERLALKLLAPGKVVAGRQGRHLGLAGEQRLVGMLGAGHEGRL